MYGNNIHTPKPQASVAAGEAFLLIRSHVQQPGSLPSGDSEVKAPSSLPAPQMWLKVHGVREDTGEGGTAVVTNLYPFSSHPYRPEHGHMVQPSGKFPGKCRRQHAAQGIPLASG